MLSCRRFAARSSGWCTAQRGYFNKTSLLMVRGSGQRSTDPPQPPVQGGWVMPSFSPTTRTGQTAGDAALTPHVRQHLMRVYNLLALGVASCACGSAAMMLTPLGKAIPYWLPMIGGFVPLLWLMFKPPASVQGRLALFFAFTTLEGMTLAPLIKVTMAKGVLGSALVLTGAVFLGFSAAALAAPRASMLALQGPLFGMLLGMIAISILNMFYPTAFAHSIVLYGGLAIFSLFVAVDTQAMIERAACGSTDHVGDALQMFLNVINIFVRIAQILRGE
jgi:FtsH-binding integral membrane protein